MIDQGPQPDEVRQLPEQCRGIGVPSLKTRPTGRNPQAGTVGQHDVQIQPVVTPAATPSLENFDRLTVKRVPKAAQKDRPGWPGVFKWCSPVTRSRCPSANVPLVEMTSRH